MAAYKRDGRKFAMLSVYDCPTARIAAAAGIETLLVGDSLAMTVLGHPDTVSVTTEEMLHHVKAVSRGAGTSMVVADMPFLSYQTSPRDAVLNAGRFMKEGRADAVKIECGRNAAPTVAAIHDAGIPIVAHIGLTPQSAGQLGGLKVQGKTVDTALKLIDDARAYQDAGAFAILMECVPAEIARLVSDALDVPTISYGAGPHCDCQGLVSSDVLGLFDAFLPKFSRRYAELATDIGKALSSYHADVVAGRFPATENCYGLPADILEELAVRLDERNGGRQ
ncbi:3-methyl-2-oxobutanoate hydroxymethyltransferase [Pacificispira sp.]|uniref:3-methyl-2-oxobutanoate hydroxymethyltransferase n=1 Tax=Pacificispira sp. TaxID=2888761 RepID=UPI003B5297A0